MDQFPAKLYPDEHLIPRKRLYSLLLTRPSKRIVMLTAGAGYGKTTLLKSFFHQFPDLLGNWITLTEPVFTFDQLMNLLPFCPNKRPSWIVIDQTEQIQLDSQETLKLVSWIEKLPPTKTLVLSGRKNLEGFPASRWKLQGTGLIINKEMLAFTRKETEEMLKESLHTKIPGNFTHYIFTLFDGWPAGIAFFCNEPPDVNSYYHFKCHVDSFYTNKDLVQYLFTEIVNKLPEHLLAFMLNISLFCKLDKELLQEYFVDTPVSDYLNDVEHIQLFFSENEGQLKLTRLFRKFFYDLAQKKIGSKTIRARNCEIALFYRKKFRFIEALSHAFAANEDQLVIEFIGDMAERYEPKEFLLILDGWLEQFSPALHLYRLSFFLFRCLPVSLTASLLEHLENIALYYKEKDLLAYTDVCHRLATINFYQGDLIKSINYYKTSLETAKSTDNVPMIALNTSLLAQMYRFIRENDTSLKLSRQALATAETRGFKQVQMHALWNMSELLLDEGNLDTARRLAEQSLDVSRECDEASIIYPMCTMSRYFRKRGDIKKALDWAGRALENARLFNIAGDMGWAKAEIAMCLRAAGQLKEAEQMLEKSKESFSGFQYMSCLVQKRLVTILCDQQKYDDATHLDKKLRNIIRKSGYTWIKGYEAGEIERHPSLKIQLLGPLSIFINGEKTHIKRKSSLRLLLLLASSGKRRWSSDELIGLLFPDETEEAATNQLYVALSVLRKFLEPDLVKGRSSTFIPYDGSHYYFEFDKVDIDLERLQYLLNKSYSPKVFSETVSVYKGELLKEYLYEEWLIEKREDIRNQYLSTLSKWLAECERNRKLQDAARILETMIKLDSYEEKYYVRYIKVLKVLGEVRKARIIADKAIEVLKNEVGIDISNKMDNLLKDVYIVRSQ
ncbi:tetratricopeptide repeat protein [Siminovitchia fortis]|uniref:tetratricopeptide repeat protein n=1 Tax=Siminovitchia fortis TaxID=254758 RepID=UPI00119D7FE8|nr:tetratricopeptide repeat protein [Siminovitchia fortis]